VTVGRHWGGAIEISLKVADFRNGSNSEVVSHSQRVRSTPMNGHRQPVAPMAPTLILDSCCDPDGFLLHRSRASLRLPQ
jgi:hypothetical protein